MSRQQFDLCFAEAAEELGFRGKLGEDGAAALVSPTPGMPVLHLVYRDDEDDVVLFAEIGFVTDDDARVYRELLELGYMGEGTRGAAFAVDAANGKVVLQRTLAVAGMDGALLVGVLGDFAEVAFRARRRLFRSVEAEGGLPPLPEPEPGDDAAGGASPFQFNLV